MDRREAEELFLKRMPGRTLAEAKRTKEGYPYILEEASFEPGTWGEGDYTQPLVRLREGAKSWELPHELEHLRQFVYGTSGPELDKGYDVGGLTRLYSTQGLTPDEAGELAYLGKPSEIAARQAAGDPSDVYQRLLAKAQLLRTKIAKPSGRKFLGR